MNAAACIGISESSDSSAKLTHEPLMSRKDESNSLPLAVKTITKAMTGDESQLQLGQFSILRQLDHIPRGGEGTTNAAASSSRG